MPTPSSSPAKPLTVSIVSHGQLDLVRPLLGQLDRFCHEVIEKVVLTLNIPERESPTEPLKRIEVQYLRNTAPKGFGANHNQAFRHCTTPWFLVLNPDIRLDSDVLSPLISLASSESGLLAPRILEPGKPTPEQHRAIITPLEIVTRKRPDYVQPVVPEWIPGLFMLFRSEAYRQIDGFDERFFMYGEDFDICARTRLAGWTLQVAEELLARHDAQRASRTDAKHLYWHVTSLLKVWSSSAFWRYWRMKRAG